MVGHGLAADIQLIGNRPGRGAPGQHQENLQLPWRHALQALIAGGVGQFGGQGLFDIGVAVEDTSHRFDQHFRRRAFGQVARGARIQGLAHQRQFVVHAEEQHAQLGQALAQAAGGFQAADAGQAEVHDHQVRHRFLHAAEGFFAAGRLAHFDGRQQRPQQAGIALAHHRVVIHQQDIHQASNGMFNASAQPAPGWLRIFSSPPRQRARSYIEYRPTPGRCGAGAPRPLSRTHRRRREP